MFHFKQGCCVLTKIGVFNLRYALTFLCASYRSLLMLSSLEVVRLCDVLFLFTAKIIPTSKYESYLLQCFRTHHFQNPYMFSSKLGRRIMEGLNLTHLIFIVWCKMRFLISITLQCAPYGIGLILAGRIKGHIQTRFVGKINALSLSSFSKGILDIGIISSVSSLGIVGVKVGTII